MDLMIVYSGIIRMIATSLTTRVGTLLFSSLMIRFQRPRINPRGTLPVLTLSVLLILFRQFLSWLICFSATIRSVQS